MVAIAVWFMRWKSFSLRSLFILMTLCCVVVGMWSVYVNPYRLQRRSLAAAYRLNGAATLAPPDGSQFARWIVTRFLGEDAYVRVVEIDLRDCQVNDAAMLELAALSHLKSLKLDNTQITDDGVSVLRGMPHLNTLHLRYTKITDRSAATLAVLPELETVYLTGTKMTDAAIDELSKRATMTTAYIRWTQISNAGAARLAAALPHCAVHHHALIPEAETK